MWAGSAVSVGSVQRLGGWAWSLALVAVLYTLGEAAVSLWVGHVGNSWGILSFGIEAVAESLSGLAILWRFAPSLSSAERVQHARREQQAAGIIGVAFLLLAAVIALEAVQRLFWGVHPHVHELAFGLAVVSLVVKPSLFWVKWQLSRVLQSTALQADAKQTLACAALSLILLVGLTAQRWWGVWWADALLALGIAAALVREGVRTLCHRHILCC
ncbi:MAG: cation transporter [Bacteroidota bacterium]|nr:cation transporter [Bacteroidota bacterium]